MDEIIKVENLIHSYGKKRVLDGLNFSVGRGRIFGLLGKNGAGKTTTINIMMGFLQQNSGKCTILGEPSYDIKPETRTRIGLLHETHLQYYFMNIMQAEKFYSAFYSKWDKSIFDALMDKLGLDHKHKISNMSCGQRSQVTLALILAQKPDLMILDDYSLGLDAGYRRLFLEYLVGYAREFNTTILITSHIVQDLEKFVDDIVILDEGKTLISSGLKDFSRDFSRYRIEGFNQEIPMERDEVIRGFETCGEDFFVYSFEERDRVAAHLSGKGFENINPVFEEMTLEDAFIGLTGKY